MMLQKELLNEIHVASGSLTAGFRWRAKRNMRNYEVKKLRGHQKAKHYVLEAEALPTGRLRGPEISQQLQAAPAQFYLCSPDPLES